MHIPLLVIFLCSWVVSFPRTETGVHVSAGSEIVEELLTQIQKLFVLLQVPWIHLCTIELLDGRDDF